MITGIPPYRSPIEQSLRCTCGARYVIYMGGGIGQGESKACERAAMLKAMFVNAEITPWLACGCGQLLELMPEGSDTIQ